MGLSCQLPGNLNSQAPHHGGQWEYTEIHLALGQTHLQAEAKALGHLERAQILLASLLLFRQVPRLCNLPSPALHQCVPTQSCILKIHHLWAGKKAQWLRHLPRKHKIRY